MKSGVDVGINTFSACPGGSYDVAKRIFDVVISAVLMVFLAPLAVMIAAAIKIDSRGPVFFVQNVVGLHGRHFRMRKFRSMHPGSNNQSHQAYLSRNVLCNDASCVDAEGKPVFKTALLNSKNITRVGRVLRKTSLDELPQLWSIFLGDMSLVGPRPSLPVEVALYQPWQFERLAVRPGLTGLYQVNARNRVPVEEMVRLDIEYVRRRSVWFDLALLAKTPFAMFNGM